MNRVWNTIRRKYRIWTAGMMLTMRLVMEGLPVFISILAYAAPDFSREKEFHSSSGEDRQNFQRKERKMAEYPFIGR